MIEVGEYGRTNLGKIIKFAWLQDENKIREKNKVILVDLMLTETRPYYYFKKDEFIVKHSKNIIDLIEEGDYVNGERVQSIIDYSVVEGGEPYKKILTGERANLGLHTLGLKYYIYEKDIKSIVTKEQFNANCYKVKE